MQLSCAASSAGAALVEIAVVAPATSKGVKLRSAAERDAAAEAAGSAAGSAASAALAASGALDGALTQVRC